jgi:hypothetical protein
MKKFFAILAIVALASCGGSSEAQLLTQLLLLLTQLL